MNCKQLYLFINNTANSVKRLEFDSFKNSKIVEFVC